MLGTFLGNFGKQPQPPATAIHSHSQQPQPAATARAIARATPTIILNRGGRKSWQRGEAEGEQQERENRGGSRNGGRKGEQSWSCQNLVAKRLTSKVALQPQFPIQNPVFKSVSPLKTSHQASHLWALLWLWFAVAVLPVAPVAMKGN